MADITADGAIRVTWAPAIADLTAPSLTEITAGEDLEGFITPDGLDIQVTTAKIDAGSIASKQDQEIPGRRKDAIVLTLKGQSDTSAPQLEENPPWTTLPDRTDGFLIVRYGLDSEFAWAAGQFVDVYACRVDDKARVPIAANEMLKFKAPLSVTKPMASGVEIAA